MPSKIEYLFLDLNSYFASVEQQENPAYRNRPLAVAPFMSGSTCAIAASYEAKAFGIRTGTRIYEAKKLCPDLIIVPARHDVYVDYHHAIMEELECHAPIETIHSVDEAACKLIGDECIPENAVKLARQIKAGIRKNIGPAIGCSIGLSCNSYLAKLGTELQKPDGLVTLYPEELPSRISHMKLTDLPWIARGIERRLLAGGVSGIEGLWRLSPGRMRQIWGSVNGQRFWYMLHGWQVPPVVTKRRMVGHSNVLSPELRRPHLAHLVTRRLTVKAASRMRRMGFWAAEIGISVRFMGRARYKQSGAIPSTQDTFIMLRGLDEMWRQMQETFGPQNILQVGVVLSKLTNQPNQCPDLFNQIPREEETAHRRRISLSRALDGLNKRYGKDTVTYGVQPKMRGGGYVGAKIAFTRIPEPEEFYE